MMRNIFDGLASRSHKKRTRKSNAAAKRSRLKKRLGCESLEQRRLLAVVSGLKFDDLNANGMLDVGEPGVPGVTITLAGTDAFGAVNISTTTAGDGTYSFAGLLAGMYSVTETVPPGAVASTPTTIDLGALGDNDVVLGASFGNYIPADIFGFKFDDLDGDGGFDVGEPGIPGVTMTLTGTDGMLNPVGPLTTTTDTTGSYSFAGLVPGDYTVTETPPAGYIPTSPTSLDATLISGDVVGLNFWNTLPTSIHGLKYEDVDGNGTYDPAIDLPLDGVAFTLTGTDGQGNVISTSTTTDVNGEFWFTDLLPSVAGTPTPGGPVATGYTVTETVPAGFVATTPISYGPVDLFSGEELVALPGQAMIPPGDPRQEVVLGQPLQFGNTVLGSIHGFKFEDLNGNGVYDPNFGEQGLPGVTFTLGGIPNMGPSFTGITVATDANGEFWFTNLLPGSYAVTETVPAGSVPTTPLLALPLNINSREELVWADGAAQLPVGDPRVEVNIGDQLIFGNTVPGSIHGFKFEDINGNGIYEPGLNEPPVAGVTFTLTGASNLNGTITPLTTATNGNGAFWFTNLLPGTYTVTETVPGGAAPSTPTTRTFTISSREEFVWQDGAANLLPLDPQSEVNVGDQLIFGNAILGSIHGFKFHDLDGDGVYEPNDNEVPLAGVEFTLTGDVDGDGNQDTVTTATDDTGQFWYTGLFPGDYFVAETVPAGYIPTTPTQSFNLTIQSGQEFVWSDGAANLDPDDPRVEVNVGQDLMFGNLAFGSVHGFKFEDLDGNGVYDPAIDVPQSGVTFTLEGTDVRGNPVSELGVSDANGQFWFTELIPSDLDGYTITEIIPDGFTPTTFNAVLGVSLFVGPGDELVYADGAANLPVGVPQVEVNVGDNLVFGNTVPGSIHGFKFEDVDGDGVYDPLLDQAQPDVFFTLTGTFTNGQPVQPVITATDVNGEFWFTNLLPGQYTVTETVPIGFNSTTLPISRDFTITSRQEYVWETGAAMIPAPQPPAVDVDQQDATHTHSISDTTFLGQTFTPTITGGLTQVDIVINSGTPTGDLILEVQSVDVASDPSGSVLGSVTIPEAGIPIAAVGQAVSFDFSATPVSLVSGQQYALVLRSTDSGPGVFWNASDATNPYAGGAALQSLNSGANWAEFLTNEDHAFTTTMQPAADPRVEVLADTTDANGLLYGNTVYGSIHGFKFFDNNGNGVYEPVLGDAPQAGVQFTLETITSDNAAMQFVGTTDVNGEFWFTDLLPSVAGQGFATGYTLTEIVPDGYVNTTPIVRNFNLFSRQELVWTPGAAMLGPFDPQVEVPVGQLLEFGNTIPGSIHGFKFEDVDGDGDYDPLTGDLPLAGVEFQLTGIDSAGNIINQIQATNDQGQFWFTDLLPSIDGIGPGTGYTVTEVVPDGFFATTDPISRDFDLFAGWELAWAPGAAMLGEFDLQTEIVVGQQLVWGNAAYGSIHGFKFEDVDGNFAYDPGIDIPQPNVVFELAGTTGLGVEINAAAVTDANGEFWITGLPPSVSATDLGTGYVLTEVVPPGFVATSSTQRFVNLRSRQEFVWRDGAAMLPPNVPQVEVNVGNQLVYSNTVPGSIHGFKFEDLNGNGVYEPNLGDFPQANVEFTLTGTDGRGFAVNENVFTDNFGNFWFTNLWPSIDGSPTPIEQVNATGYTVTEIVPVGYVSTTPPLARDFDLGSRQELVWVPGAALLPPQPLPQIDQVQVDGAAGNAEAAGTTFQAQTFTPAVPGQLTQVNLSVQANPGVGDVTLQIQSVDLITGEPSGDVLGTVTIPAASVPIGVNQNLGFDFSGQSLTLAAGFSYAMVLSSTVDGALGWDFANTDPYAQGIAYQSLNSGATWGGLPQVDYVFVTTMLQPGDPRVEVFIDPDQSGRNEGLMWGNTLPGQIHGLKFDDTNGDGILDPGEPRLEGWEIQLLNEAGTVLQTEFTNVDGEFWFVDLMPGTYFVREVQQEGWLQTTHDPQPYVVTRGEVYVAYAGLGMLDPFDVREEIIDKCLNFGNTVTSSVHGYKFHDLDGNGIDDNDPRVAGVTIILIGDVDGDGVEDQLTTLTDDNGEYWFEDIYPGIYSVTEVVPDGWVPTKDTTAIVNLARGEEAVALLGQSTAMGPLGEFQFESNPNPDLAFGNAYLGSIHGYKFKDVNGDGIDNDGGIRVAGVTIVLQGDVDGDGDGDVVEAQTDANGEYWFEDLYPGTYSVTEIAPSGTIQTAGNGFNGVLANVTIVSGEEAVAEAGQSTVMGPLLPGQFESAPNPDLLAFGNFYPGEIHGHKFEDLNGNGVEDAEDPRFNGWTIVLTDANGNAVVDFFGNQVQPVVTQTIDLNNDGVTQTNEVGLYWFNNLLPGEYLVREVQQNGFLQTTHDSQPIVITGGQIFVAKADQTEFNHDAARKVIIDKCLAFGNILTSSIHGYKFHDLNGDGIDDFDPRLAGVTITLVGDVNNDGIQDQIITQTDVNGEYWFEDLYPGTYTISEIVPEGYMASTPTSVTITIGFGEEAVAEAGQSTRFGPLGEFQFESAPNPNLAFGNTIKGSIHGHKFKDKDFDSFEDANEPRIAGIEIRLFGDVDNDGFTDTVTTFTNENGEYWFTDLWPGFYTVQEIPAPGTIATTGEFRDLFVFSGVEYVSVPGQSERMGPLPAIKREEFIPGFGFGNFYPGEIHGHKFEDLNGDGVEDAGEQRVPGFTIRLTDLDGNRVFDAFGQLVEDVETNEFGEYWFVNLLPDTYLVREIIPEQVDQGQLNRTNTYTAFGDFEVAQTFVPGVHGKLTQVDIAVTVSAPVGDVILEIQTVDLFGQPTGQVIASSTVAAANVPIGVNQPMNFTFIKPAHLLTTEQYAIVVRSPSTAFPGDFAWDFASPGNYAGGISLQSLNNGGSWDSLPGSDQVFTTTMTPYTGYVQTTHDPQPITITGGQIYVAQLDQNPYGHDPSRIVIVDKCLSFGNQQHGKIVWDKFTSKRDELTGEYVPLGGVIFELTQTHMYDQTLNLLMDVPDVTVTVVDNLAPDASLVFGNFAVKDLPLGRYTLRETVPVPGYDLDPRVATIDLTPDDFKQDAGDWFNSWSKRAFVGSTLAARLEYLETLGLLEMELLNGGGFFGGGAGGGGFFGGETEGEPFRVGLMLGESEDVVELIHQTTGLRVAEGELIGAFQAITTDLDEYLTVDLMPRLGSLDINVGGGNDVIDVKSLDFDSLDGGEGHDVLKLRKLGALSLLGSSISGIEELELTADGQQLTVSEALVEYLNGGTLRVRHQSGEQLNFDGSWEMAAPMMDGGDVVQVLKSGGKTVEVVNDNPWQNVLDRFDVDGNGEVTARDALVGLNSVERYLGSALPTDSHAPEMFYDVNADGTLSSLDVLQVINLLGEKHIAEAEQLVAPTSSEDGSSDTQLDDGPQAVDSGTSHVASFDGPAWSSEAVGEALSDGSDDATSNEELESTLALLAIDGGR